MNETRAEAMTNWKDLWRAQMTEGLALRRRLWESEDNVVRRRNDVHRAQEALDTAEHDLVLLREEYALSSETAHAMFDYFRKELEHVPSGPEQPTS